MRFLRNDKIENKNKLKKNYNDSCTYILLNNKLVLEYGRGAIGSQCFYNMR